GTGTGTGTGAAAGHGAAGPAVRGSSRPGRTALPGSARLCPALPGRPAPAPALGGAAPAPSRSPPPRRARPPPARARPRRSRRPGCPWRVPAGGRGGSPQGAGAGRGGGRPGGYEEPSPRASLRAGAGGPGARGAEPRGAGPCGGRCRLDPGVGLPARGPCWCRGSGTRAPVGCWGAAEAGALPGNRALPCPRPLLGAGAVGLAVPAPTPGPNLPCAAAGSRLAGVRRVPAGRVPRDRLRPHTDLPGQAGAVPAQGAPGARAGRGEQAWISPLRLLPLFREAERRKPALPPAGLRGGRLIAWGSGGNPGSRGFLLPVPAASCTWSHGAAAPPGGDTGGGDGPVPLAAAPLPLPATGSAAQPCCRRAALAARAWGGPEPAPPPQLCPGRESPSPAVPALQDGGSRDSGRAGAGLSGHRWQCQGHGIAGAVFGLPTSRELCWLRRSGLAWAAVTPAPWGALRRGQGVLGNPQRRPPLPGSVGAAVLALPLWLLSRLFISLRRSRPPPPPPPPAGRGRGAGHHLRARGRAGVRGALPASGLGGRTVAGGAGPVHGSRRCATGALNAAGQQRPALPCDAAVPAAAPPSLPLFLAAASFSWRFVARSGLSHLRLPCWAAAGGSARASPGAASAGAAASPHPALLGHPA
ncbi:uncharacterized protein, partial [Ciconia boyciana]|uniref:uncharacterized protein n=1 Tax=Ciconia boyciana TaxID=52775 RepID=UPI003B9E901E